MWVIFYAVLSLLFIYIGHQSYLYFIEPYKKKKFVVSSQIEKYKSIIRELQETSDLSTYPTVPTVPTTLSDNDDLKNDLEVFLQEVGKN